jgi:hypothetical protein
VFWIWKGCFPVSKNFVLKSTMFPHHNIYKYTWTFPEGKMHSQIDHVLLDRSQHSSVLYIRSLRWADCGTNCYHAAINRVWDIIRGNIRISAKESLGYCEWKHHEPWITECSKLVGKRKQVKLQWMQVPNEVN